MPKCPKTRRGLLVRVGIDGGCKPAWYTPWDPTDGSFVWVPIPEGEGNLQLEACQTPYRPFLENLARFCDHKRVFVNPPPSLTADLLAHVDPDFDNSTYGDRPVRRDGHPNSRGQVLASLQPDDFLVFWAAMRSIHDGAYTPALVGFYHVDRVAPVKDLPPTEVHKNAHARLRNALPTDVVIFARPDGGSGRFQRAIPIGSFCSGRHQLSADLVATWGLRGPDIHRGVRWLRNPSGFLNWLTEQRVLTVSRKMSHP